MTIPPPLWAALPTDPIISQSSSPQPVPDIIPISDSASCSCSDVKNTYNPATPTSTRQCIVYDICKAYDRVIELQGCTVCRRRMVGPDCSNMRLFNYNNRILLTHDLLNDYTSAYTTSETPFTAWVTVVARRYESQRSEHKFLSEPMFRAAWFAFVQLQYLDGDMECPHCGPSPENTIWDGVTLAFSQKHLLPSLQPPTTVFDDAPERNRTRYVYKQQLLPDKDVRSLVRSIISGPSLLLANTGSGATITDSDGRVGIRIGPDDESAKKEFLARIEAIPLACKKLMDVHASLGALFEQHFGLIALVNRTWGVSVYHRFFLQVRLCCGGDRSFSLMRMQLMELGHCRRVCPTDDNPTGFGCS